MLNLRYKQPTFSTTPAPMVILRLVKDESEVKRTVPALQPVATIVIGGGNAFDARPLADIYSLPDGTLIRLRLNDDNTYDYKNATAVPDTHPAARAFKEKPGHSMEVTLSEEGKLGPHANPADVKKLQDWLEADMRRYHEAQNRTRPALQPIAIIYTGEGGYEGRRPHAFVYPLSEGTLIRLPFKDNNTLDYEGATTVPPTHPAAKAYGEKRRDIIDVIVAEEGDLGRTANSTDVKRLKKRLDADRKRYYETEKDKKLEL